MNVAQLDAILLASVELLGGREKLAQHMTRARVQEMLDSAFVWYMQKAELLLLQHGSYQHMPVRPETTKDELRKQQHEMMRLTQTFGAEWRTGHVSHSLTSNVEIGWCKAQYWLDQAKDECDPRNIEEVVEMLECNSAVESRTLCRHLLSCGALADVRQNLNDVQWERWTGELRGMLLNATARQHMYKMLMLWWHMSVKPNAQDLLTRSSTDLQALFKELILPQLQLAPLEILTLAGISNQTHLESCFNATLLDLFGVK